MRSLSLLASELLHWRCVISIFFLPEDAPYLPGRMQKPPIPANEAARLAAVQNLNLLDSLPEERFDRITRLAARLFNVPMALVTLVDSNRNWFKSKRGMTNSEDPRDLCFCAHAIAAEEDIMEIPDPRADVRFADNPLVLQTPGIGFYAGCTIKSPNGLNVGTLCLVDTVPRKLTDTDYDSLRDLAAMVEREFAMQMHASIDDLTGLSNRRGFLELAEKAFAHARHAGVPLEVFFFDLDDFKAINDQFGHAAGDAALQAFSRILSDVFGHDHLVARLGGDEFLVLCAGALRGPDLLHQFLSQIGAFNEKSRQGWILKSSMGSVRFDPARHDTLAALLKEADDKMFLQKKVRKEAGRNA